MPKVIHGSVGMGGSNSYEDVRTVQYLLNCVPAKAGGRRWSWLWTGLRDR